MARGVTRGVARVVARGLDRGIARGGGWLEGWPEGWLEGVSMTNQLTFYVLINIKSAFIGSNCCKII